MLDEVINRMSFKIQWNPEDYETFLNWILKKIKSSPRRCQHRLGDIKQRGIKRGFTVVSLESYGMEEILYNFFYCYHCWNAKNSTSSPNHHDALKFHVPQHLYFIPSSKSIIAENFFIYIQKPQHKSKRGAVAVATAATNKTLKLFSLVVSIFLLVFEHQLALGMLW